MHYAPYFCPTPYFVEARLVLALYQGENNYKSQEKDMASLTPRLAGQDTIPHFPLTPLHFIPLRWAVEIERRK
jgi:quinol-cytochrome oxidoreductase complex cytochrome b subunit